MNIKPHRSHARFVLLAAAVLVVASSATAGAAALITGQGVKNESLTGSRHPQRHRQGRRRHATAR